MAAPGVEAARALSGEEGHSGVRALLQNGRAAVEETLHSMLGPEQRLRSLRLRRAKFKPGRKLTATYDVALADAAQPTPVAVTWFAGGAPTSAPQLAAAEQSLREAGAFTRFDRLWAIEPSRGMVVMAAPLDPAFPGLGRLSDPRNVSATLALSGADAGDDRNGYTVRPIRYRPGQRHVLEYRGPKAVRFFVKIYRPGAVADVANAVTAFADVLDHAGSQGAHALRPAAVLGDADAILFLPAKGRPLSQRLRRGQAAPAQLQAVGRLLRAIHSVAPEPAWRLRRRDLDGEVSAVLKACEAMTGLEPGLGVRAVSVVERVQESLQAMDPGAATVVHGDLKADHLLFGPQGLTVLDTDRSALADPALDIGKLLADLSWWSWVGAWPDPFASQADLLAGYGPAAALAARARLYSGLLLIKIAARRISVARRDWAARTAGLLELAGQAVSGRPAW